MRRSFAQVSGGRQYRSVNRTATYSATQTATAMQAVSMTLTPITSLGRSITQIVTRYVTPTARRALTRIGTIPKMSLISMVSAEGRTLDPMIKSYVLGEPPRILIRLSPHSPHAGADVHLGPLAHRTRRGPGRGERPSRPLEQAEQFFGNEARP